MNVSFLLQTRGRPELFNKLCISIFAMAKYPDQVEVIARLDFDDPELQRYIRINPNVHFIYGERHLGYASMAQHINECYRWAQGKIVCQICDDAFILTEGYDQIWLQYMKPVCVMSSTIVTNQIGGEFRFTFSAVPKSLCDILGEYALEGDILIDRVWGCFADHAACEVATPVVINHDYQMDNTAKTGLKAFEPERDINWADRMEECNRIAKRAIEKVNAHGQDSSLLRNA